MKALKEKISSAWRARRWRKTKIIITTEIDGKVIGEKVIYRRGSHG